MASDSRESYVLGLDVGTSGTKAILINDSGKIAGQGYRGYRLYTEGSSIEQDPDDWWDACIAAVRQTVPGNIARNVRAMSLSTQGATMAALDASKKPIGRAITWMDTRAQKEADRIESLLGKDTVYRICGWRTGPCFDAAKILYMKSRDEYKEAVLYLSTIEYINMKLTGLAVIDPTNAAIRQLCNIKTGKWDERILDAVGANEKELPPILKTGALIGNLTPEAASSLGLDEGVKVYNGAHDQYCASIGCGAVNAGDMLVSTGTAWVLMGITEEPIFSDTYISSCSHPAGGLYGNMVSLSGAGASYQWIKDIFLPEENFSSIDSRAAQEISKCGNLYFIPWLSGAAYPVWNMNARGGFAGMDFSNNPYSMALAVMEAAAFSLRNAIADFKAYGFRPGIIRIMGGAAKSAVWLDILAAVIDIPFRKMEISDSCALGAAFIAACGEGWYRDYSSAARTVVKEERIPETKLNRNLYEEKFKRYNEILGAAKKLYSGGNGT